MQSLRTRVLTVLLVLVLGGFLLGQQTNAKIVGVVTDADGNPLPGVTVEATSPNLVGSASAITDDTGTYRLLNLYPGTYKLVYSLEGFQTIIRENIALRLEQTITVKVSLTLGSIDEKITVTGQAPLIDVKSTAKAVTLTKETFQSLPKGRNFDSLITTVPGISNEGMLAGTSVEGASGLENMYYVDGVDTTNMVSGSSGQSVAFDFVEEVQFKAGGYQAEFGGSLGGVINVVTRSGGNAFHGEVLGFYSGSALRAENRDELSLRPGNTEAYYEKWNSVNGVPTDSRIEGGFNLGGFVVKDKLWFFGSFLPVFSNSKREITYFDKNAPNYLGDTTKTWKRSEETWNWQIKLTSQPMKNLRISASVVNNLYKYKGDRTNWKGNSSPDVSFDDYGYTYPNMSGSLSADWTIGNNFMLSLRGGYFKSNQVDPLVLPFQPYYKFGTEAPGGYYDTTQEGLSIPAEYQQADGYANASGYPISNLKNLNERFSINADLTYFLNLAGEHSWKAGVQFIRQGENVDQKSAYPIIRLGWNRDFIAYGTNYGRGTYGYYAVRGNDDTGPYGSLYKAYSNRWAIYLQDSWTISNRFTINFGLRTESEYIPSYSSDPLYADVDKAITFDFGEKLAPRIGFVYDVMGDSSLKVFGSFGYFFDVMKLSMAAGSYGGVKWKSAYYPLNTYEWNKIGLEGWNYENLYTVLDFRAPSFDLTDPDMKPMSQQEISIGVEKKLRDDLALTARLVNKNLRWAIEDIGVLTAEGEQYYTTNPGGDFIKQKWIEAKNLDLIPDGAPDIPKAKRLYWGLNLALDKRFSNNWMGGISYTWSRLTGNYSGLASGDEYGRASPNVERYFDLWYLAFDKNMDPIDGPMPGDRTHAFKLYGSYHFPFGLTVGTIVNAFSGIPVSTEYAMDVQGYLPNNRGDLGRTPFTWFADLYAEYNLKIAKKYNLQFSVNVDNLFDTKTAQRIYQIYNRGSVALTDEVILSKNWNIDDYEPTLEPRFKKETWFFGPLVARLGVKFSF